MNKPDWLGQVAWSHLRRVAPNFEFHHRDGDTTVLVCARCKQQFAYPDSGRWLIPVAHLGAHLLRHGVDLGDVGRLDRRTSRLQTKVRAAGASHRPALWPDADRAEPGAGPVRRR